MSLAPKLQRLKSLQPNSRKHSYVDDASVTDTKGRVETFGN